MKIDYGSLLGIAYCDSVFMSILALITFSFFSLMYLNLVYKHCTQNKYTSEEQAITILLAIIYTAVFMYLVPLTSIAIFIFFAIKTLPNKEKQC